MLIAEIVDEHVLSRVLFDEAVPLGVIEPFHFSPLAMRATSNRVNRSYRPTTIQPCSTS